MSFPPGLEWRQFDGEEHLATKGEPVYGEETDGEWRQWDRSRSKLAVLLGREIDIALEEESAVLYLGAASGTTISHVADIVGPTYGVEFAPRPMRDLVAVAEDRPNLFPLLKDARTPASYAHVVEPVDLIVQDVAIRGQGAVAVVNKQFLREDGQLVVSIKARSEDVTRDPEDVFEDVLATIETEYEILRTESLDPFHDDHLGVVAEPK